MFGLTISEHGASIEVRETQKKEMRYIVFFNGEPPFYTAFFDSENLFVIGMTVVDTSTLRYTKDGTTWIDMQIDHL